MNQHQTENQKRYINNNLFILFTILAFIYFFSIKYKQRHVIIYITSFFLNKNNVFFNFFLLKPKIKPMGSEKDLTATQKGAIIYGYLKKDSYRTIAANVGCKKSVVGNVIGKYRETGTTELQKKCPGRSSLLTISDRSILKTLVINGNRRLNAAKVTNTFTAQTKLRVSKKTIRCALKKENLKSCITRSKPLLSSVNALNRLT